MNHHRSISMRAASLGIVLAAAACTAGNGTVDSVPFPAPREPAPNARESAGATRENPGNDRQNPGNDRQNPGNDRDPPGGSTSGGGTGEGTGGTCPACDTTYECTSVLADAGRETFSVDLQSKNGACEIAGSGLLFNCDGTITPTKGSSGRGTWTAVSGGGFRVTGNGTTTTCLPESSSGGTGGSAPPSG